MFNFMPQGASPALYEPPSPYKVALAPSFFTMSSSTLDFIMKKKSYKRIGILYQDDDYGREALEGVEAHLKAKGLALVEKTSYKRGATEFSSQMAKLKAANCDLVFKCIHLARVHRLGLRSAQDRLQPGLPRVASAAALKVTAFSFLPALSASLAKVVTA